MARRGPQRATPFGSAVFRWRAVGGDKPEGLTKAEIVLRLLRTYPGYTLDTLDRDGLALLQLEAALDPDLGKAED